MAAKTKRPPPIGRAQILERLRVGEELKRVYSRGRDIYTFLADGMRGKEKDVQALFREHRLRIVDKNYLALDTPEDYAARCAEWDRRRQDVENDRIQNRVLRLTRWADELLSLATDRQAFIKALERIAGEASVNGLEGKLD